jgi:hypothetical protein
MDFETAFPLRFWINLGRRDDRRVETEARLDEIGISAERFAAVDARGIGKQAARRPLHGLERNVPILDAAATIGPAAATQEVRGYESAGRYALALTQRLAIREAARRKAPAVLLLEDDVVFHPNFWALIESVELPEDWGIFYLGCTHNQPPEWAGTRVVRAKYAVDTHAIAVRAPYYKRVMEILDRHGKPELGVAKASDQFIALLHREIPAYACYPNLAWQDVSGSDLLGVTYSNYNSDGLQRNWAWAVDGLLAELIGAACSKIVPEHDAPAFARLGLLFLTKGDVNHPQIWQEFVAEAPDRVRVFSHAKHPEKLKGGFLEGTEISEHFETVWGGIGLVKASRAMLLEALEDESLTHFVLLSESCVPIRPLPEILRRLEIDPRPQIGYKTLKAAPLRQGSRAEAVPQMPKGCWRFQPQWWLLDRVAATFSAGKDFTEMFEKMPVPDEAYFATVLAMQGYPLEGIVLKKDVTWTSWEKDAGSPSAWETLPKDRLADMIHSGGLFARKFPKGADIGKYGLHRSIGPAVAAEPETSRK